MKYQSYINTLREACDIFIGMAASLSNHMAQLAEKEVGDLFESLENEKSIEYDRIVVESISKADNAFEAVGAGINAILEAIPFIYIGGDGLVLKITEFMRNQAYTGLSSINEIDIEEEAANVMSSTAGTSSSNPSSHPLGDDYMKRTIPAMRRHMAQKSDKVTNVMESAGPDSKCPSCGSSNVVWGGEDADDSGIADGEWSCITCGWMGETGADDVIWESKINEGIRKCPNCASKDFSTQKISATDERGDFTAKVTTCNNCGYEGPPSDFFLGALIKFGESSLFDYDPDMDIRPVIQAMIDKGMSDRAISTSLEGKYGSFEKSKFGFQDQKDQVMDFIKHVRSGKEESMFEDENIASQSDRAIMSVNFTPPEAEYTRTSQGPIDNPSMVDATVNNAEAGIVENKTSWKIIGEDVNGTIHEIIYHGTRSWEAIDFAKSQGIFPYEITEMGSMGAVLNVNPQTDDISYPDEPEGEEGITKMQRVGGGPGLTEAKTCPGCQFTNKTMDKECGGCGKKLEEKLHEGGSLPDHYCPECGSPDIKYEGINNDGKEWFYCESCGYDGLLNVWVTEADAAVQQTPEINQLAQNKGTTPITQDGDYTQGTQSLAGQDKQPKAKDDGVGDEEGGLPNAKAVSDQNDAQIVEKDDDYDEDDDEDESKEELDKKRGRDLEESIDLLTTKVFSQSLNEEQVVHNDDMDTFLLEYGAGERNIPVSELDSATPGMKNAYTRVGGGPACAACGFEMPKYPGAYPKFCSNCGTKSMQPDDVQVDSSDPGIGIAGESEVQKGSLMEEMGVDDLINKATGVSDSVMLNRGKK